jgi:hypothetical protein
MDHSVDLDDLDFGPVGAAEMWWLLTTREKTDCTMEADNTASIGTADRDHFAAIVFTARGEAGQGLEGITGAPVRESDEDGRPSLPFFGRRFLINFRDATSSRKFSSDTSIISPLWSI